MQQITDIGSIARQEFRFQVENGELADFVLYFSQTQRCWFMDLTYGDFQTKGLRVVNSINILAPYKNILRFGLLCHVKDGYEPWFVDDFENGRASLYITSIEEINTLENLAYA